jgi:hypothetical protein
MNVRSCLALAALLFFAAGAHAEPYFAVRTGLKCVQCHANVTGGGLRTPFGNAYAQTGLPARRLRVEEEPWSGMLGRYVAIGGNLRANFDHVDVPDQDERSAFDVAEGRIFVEASVIPGRLSVYVDEQLAPGDADNREANVRLWLREGTWYVKAGKMYLPFGWRLEDDNAFVRQVSGINMTTADDAVEVGLEYGAWSAQLAVSNGTAGGPELDNGKQLTLRAAHVRPTWRAGLSASFNDTDAGDRYALALHAGIRTGPIAWLGEVDYIDDDGLGPTGRQLFAALGEANWMPRRGHNVKLTFEWFDPDDDVDEDEQTRTSLVYELTPVEFLQLRVGARVYDGIPQNALQNREQYFIELHGFF